MLDGALDLVVVGVWSGVCDVGVKETEWERQMASESEQNGVIGGDQFFETGHDVVLVLGLGA